MLNSAYWTFSAYRVVFRGALIQYSGSVLLRYWHFLLDRGIGLTRPIQIRYSATIVLLLSPTKATDTL